MKPYELLLIITPDHDENEAEALTDQVKSIIESGGAIVKVDPWGKKRLAYPIQKRNEGYYVLYIFESAPSFVAELNQSLHVIEAILRYMIVQYEDDINKLKAELAAEAEQPTPKAEQSTSETKQSTSETEESTSDGDAAEVETEDATDDDNAETVDEDATDNDAEAENTTESA
ncbi:30S ribosomal protein S6 [Candidatus Poribacteria bacterium]|nr:30S ribosomal protein S6 [Candidatus Poribacteria bacterium]